MKQYVMNEFRRQRYVILFSESDGYLYKFKLDEIQQEYSIYASRSTLYKRLKEKRGSILVQTKTSYAKDTIYIHYIKLEEVFKALGENINTTSKVGVMLYSDEFTCLDRSYIIYRLKCLEEDVKKLSNDAYTQAYYKHGVTVACIQLQKGIGCTKEVLSSSELKMVQILHEQHKIQYKRVVSMDGKSVEVSFFLNLYLIGITGDNKSRQYCLASDTTKGQSCPLCCVTFMYPHFYPPVYHNQYNDRQLNCMDLLNYIKMKVIKEREAYLNRVKDIKGFIESYIIKFKSLHIMRQNTVVLLSKLQDNDD